MAALSLGVSVQDYFLNISISSLLLLRSIFYFTNLSCYNLLFLLYYLNIDDPNVFAVLIPRDETNRARTAFYLLENVKRFYKATRGVAKEPTIDS